MQHGDVCVCSCAGMDGEPPRAFASKYEDLRLHGCAGEWCRLSCRDTRQHSDQTECAYARSTCRLGPAPGGACLGKSDDSFPDTVCVKECTMMSGHLWSWTKCPPSPCVRDVLVSVRGTARAERARKMGPLRIWGCAFLAGHRLAARRPRRRGTPLHHITSSSTPPAALLFRWPDVKLNRWVPCILCDRSPDADRLSMLVRLMMNTYDTVICVVVKKAHGR